MEKKNGLKSYIVIALSIVIVGMFVWFISSYNALVNKEEQVKVAWSQVESNLQRKLDLLPNLVKVVKAYAAHEKELLTEVAKLRSNALKELKSSTDMPDATKIASMQKMQAKLDGSVMKLFAVAENYPELKSSEQFLQLQSQIEGAENRINITRMQFNEAVGAFNAYIRTMPANIVSSIGSFKQKAYFKAETEAHKKLDLKM